MTLQFRRDLARYLQTKASADLTFFIDGEESPRFFPSSSTLHSLTSAYGEGRLESSEYAATCAHFARAAYERTLMPLRRQLVTRRDSTLRIESQTTSRQAAAEHWYLGRHLGAFEALGEPLSAEAQDAESVVRQARRAAVDILDGHEPHPDAGPATKQQNAKEFLETSSDLCAALLGEEDLFRWVAALQLPRHQDPCGPKDRYRRIGEVFGELGLTNELSSRVKVTAPHRQAHPKMRSAQLSPLDVRLMPSNIEMGCTSELDALRCVARGLALSFASPGLPLALRRPCVGTVAHSFGWCVVQRLGLAGAGRASGEQAQVRQLVLRVLMCQSRLSAGILTGELRSVSESGLGTRVPLHAVRWASLSSAHGSIFRSVIGGLLLWVAMREQFDEDWYRNPRSSELLTSAFERGGTLSIETLLEELGQPWSHQVAINRLAEWMP